jgi:hypothetical protein
LYPLVGGDEVDHGAHPSLGEGVGGAARDLMLGQAGFETSY